MSEDTCRVLICDDDETIRTLLQEILTDADFQVEIAGDGAEGLVKCQNQHFDVVITDINMPNMDGVELLQKIKGFNERCEVIIMTAQATIDSAIASTRFGAFDYLRKPFEDIEVITPLIEKAYQKASAGRATEALFQQMIGRASELMQSVSGTSYLTIESKNSSTRYTLDASPVVIGRDRDSIVSNLPENCLGKHAEIIKTGELWKIKPYGPIFVNGLQLRTPSFLMEGMKLNIADTTITFRKDRDLLNINRAMQALQEDLKQRSETDSIKLSGSLESILLPDLLQVILALNEDGIVTLRSLKARGEIYFAGGKIVYANTAELINAKALFRMTLWQEGDFCFTAAKINVQDFQPNLQEDTTVILLEICRQVDEFNNIKALIPDPTLQLGVSVDWLQNNDLQDAIDENTLRNVVKHKYADLVISKSIQSDLDAIKRLIKLRKDGAIVVL